MLVSKARKSSPGTSSIGISSTERFFDFFAFFLSFLFILVKVPSLWDGGVNSSASVPSFWVLEGSPEMNDSSSAPTTSSSRPLSTASISTACLDSIPGRSSAGVSGIDWPRDFFAFFLSFLLSFLDGTSLPTSRSSCGAEGAAMIGSTGSSFRPLSTA